MHPYGLVSVHHGLHRECSSGHDSALENSAPGTLFPHSTHCHTCTTYLWFTWHAYAQPNAKHFTYKILFFRIRENYTPCKFPATWYVCYSLLLTVIILAICLAWWGEPERVHSTLMSYEVLLSMWGTTESNNRISKVQWIEDQNIVPNR